MSLNAGWRLRLIRPKDYVTRSRHQAGNIVMANHLVLLKSDFFAHEQQAVAVADRYPQDVFAEANLKNAIDAASGLLVGLLYLHDAQYKKSLRVDGFLRPKILVPHGAGGEAWDGKFEYPIQPNKD